MKTITDPRGPEEDSPEHDPADSLPCSGLSAQLRLEQRILRPKDGMGFGKVKIRADYSGNYGHLHKYLQKSNFSNLLM